MKDIMIGRKTDNVFYYIWKCQTAKYISVVLWSMFYFVLYGYDIRIINIVVTVFITLNVMNLVLVPYRFFKSKKISILSKAGVIIVGIMIAYYYFGNAITISNISISEEILSFVSTICFVLFMVLTLQNKLVRKYNKYSINDVDTMDGWEFEHWCEEKLRRQGFHHVTVTAGSGDFGVDILAWKNNLKYGIQCKRYSGTVGYHAVEEAIAGAKYYDCDVAAVMTNSEFTKQAREGATKLGVELWNCSL